MFSFSVNTRERIHYQQSYLRFTRNLRLLRQVKPRLKQLWYWQVSASLLKCSVLLLGKFVKETLLMFLFTEQNLKWAASWQNQHSAFATNMDPDQPAHLAVWSGSMLFTIGFSSCYMVCKQIALILIRLRGWAGWSWSMLVANPLCWFCRDVAHFYLQNRTRNIVLRFLYIYHLMKFYTSNICA
jgi:hypothetical protein